MSLRVVLLKSLRLISDSATCSSPGGELQIYLNPVKTWLCWLSLKRIEFRVCIQKAYSRVSPFFGLTVVWWIVLVSFSKQCCLSGDPRMMSLATWLYIWKWSKSRWPWLKWLLCACLCVTVHVQTLQYRFVFELLWSPHWSHLLSELWGISIGFHVASTCNCTAWYCQCGMFSY